MGPVGDFVVNAWLGTCARRSFVVCRSHSSSQASLELFLTVAAQLNQQLGVVPVLYGSLGLNRVIGAAQSVGDVDILVPAVCLAERWPELVVVMEGLRFALIDVREREWRRGAGSVAFADEESLLPFAGIDPSTLRISTVDGVRFKELSPAGYLAVYRVSQHDGYRREKRGKWDAEKIAQIEHYLALQAGGQRETPGYC